mmetsp:Transcript_4762/g.15643  ORF Transcript_4762/g.15643 Transcript_4762/m.15643 type:complete len:87 (+) Transcript_4762:573-833(+)
MRRALEMTSLFSILYAVQRESSSLLSSELTDADEDAHAPGQLPSDKAPGVERPPLVGQASNHGDVSDGVSGGVRGNVNGVASRGAP